MLKEKDVILFGIFYYSKRQKSTKKQFLKDLLEDFVDIHNHILPGIDDGSASLAESIMLIKNMKNLGITQFIATPHIMADFYPNNETTIGNAYQSLILELRKKKLNDIIVNPSAEYMMDNHFEILIDQAIECMNISSREFCYDQFSKLVNTEFNIYKPSPLTWEQGHTSGKSLFTAYYSPDFEGSRVKTPVFKNAIYKLPKSSKLRALSREDIDFNSKLSGMNLELFYVTDFFQQSSFDPSHQVICVYYSCKLKKPSILKTASKKFDFKVEIERAESFRWQNLNSLTVDDFAFPIDKVVVEKLLKET